MEKGNPDDAAGLEPVMALLSKYSDPSESARIAEDFAKMNAAEEAASAWEKKHPRPVQDTVIRFWPVRSTEYPTRGQTGPEAPVLPLTPGAPAK